MTATSHNTIEELLTDWMRAAFEKAHPDASDALGKVSVVSTASAEFGDYQCNAAMGLAKVLKRSPRDIAQVVVDSIDLHDAVDRVEIAGAGFLNIYLSDGWLGAQLVAMIATERVGVPECETGKTIVMDYGSPNMSKPLHIGHLRSPNIGSTLDRMHRFLGCKVIADNHLGDWGTQFGITLMGYRHFGDEQAMKEAPMEELERVYVESYDRGKSDDVWKKQCREELVKLQSGDEENLTLWKMFMSLSLKELDRVYARLGVSFDVVRGESYYSDKLQGIIDFLTDKGIAEKSEGAMVVFLEEEKLPVAIVQKSDGGFNYATTDLATIVDREAEFKPDKVLYITDERQQLHFKQLFTIAKKMGIEVDLEHVWFGLMRLPEGTFSTRDGNVIKLERLLDEAELRALAIVKEQSPDMDEVVQQEVARAVGMGAVKYADLSQNTQSLVTFTWDKAMALNGNSAPYLQYAYARIASVRDKYAERFPDGNIDAHAISITEATERALAVKLIRFPETLIRATQASKPNVLCDYLYELAQAYSSYYQNVPFLKAEEGTRESRVRLCGVAAAVIKKGLDLLGIDTPARI